MARPDLKVSLITTERNEADSIGEFIDSAMSQSRPPDEIIIADGGSTDGTVEIINQRIKAGAPIKLVKAPGNRSVGRNAATRAASYQIIACTDVGSRLDRNWLRYITEPFQDPKVMAVAGNFKADPRTDFERISAALMLQGNDQIDLKTWLPSSRSVAYRKAAWENVGGYPEHTNFNEDTPFDLALKAAGYDFADGLKAIAYWRPRSTLREFYRQYYFYAVGDALDHIHGQWITGQTVTYLIILAAIVFSLVVKPIAVLVPLGLLGLKLARRSYGGWKTDRSIKALFLMPFLVMVFDLSQIHGYLYGSLNRSKLRNSRRLVR